MFKGSGIYTEAKKDDVGVILADEAHRLNAKSGMFKNQGENQIKVSISAEKADSAFMLLPYYRKKLKFDNIKNVWIIK